jgi:peptide/nickel transport system permease protein
MAVATVDTGREPPSGGVPRSGGLRLPMKVRIPIWLVLWAAAWAGLIVADVNPVWAGVLSLGVSMFAWWGYYFAMRILRAFFVIWVVITGVFFLLRLLPGNPVQVYIGKLTSEGMGYAEAKASAEGYFSLNLDVPVWRQYLDYVWGAVQGDFGITLSKITVLEKISHHLPWTLFSVGFALIISVSVGLLLGMVMAYRRGGFIDHAASAIGSTLHAIPNYLLALIIVTVGGVQLGLFNYYEQIGTYSSGIQPDFSFEFLSDAMYHATLPVVAYVLTTVGTWALIMKASTTQALGEDYVMVARARGLGGGRIGTMYVGRNAVLPLVAQIATQAGFVVGGAIFVELIFQYNGIGITLYKSINARDYALVQGILLIITFTVVFANLIADFTYGLLDPRIRTSDKELSA